MRASLSANGSEQVGEGLPKRFGGRLHKGNNGTSFLELFFAFGQDIGCGYLTPVSEMFFVAGEHVVELLLCFHVHGEGWSV